MDWDCSVNGDVSKVIPSYIPSSKGDKVTLSHYVDANFLHDSFTAS